MKKLTSNIIRVLYTLSSIVMVPAAFMELFEIFRVKTMYDPRRNWIDALFWGSFAVYHLCHWYIMKHKNTLETL